MGIWALEKGWSSPGGWQGLTVLGSASLEGYYLHLDFGTSHQGWMARLLSSPIWEQGPLCVHFAYYMFGLSWGAQLKLLLLTGTKNSHPNLLWKHINIQSPSWMPTTVTVPKGHVLPTQVSQGQSLGVRWESWYQVWGAQKGLGQ